MNDHPYVHPHPIEGVELPPPVPFPTAPFEGESVEQFAERKRDWARKSSERIQMQCWAAPGYVPE